MRRYTFYLSVALLAFGIGSFVVFNFYWTHSSKNATQQELQIDEVKPVKETIAAEMPKIEFSCEDEVMKTVWERLKKNKIFKDDAYGNVIEPNHIKDCRELFEVRPINLDDESDAFVVSGNQYLFCDSGGDCQTWIISKSNNRYKIIFESTAGDSTRTPHLPKDVTPLPTKTHKFKDIKVFIPNGWGADNIGYFKFDGNRYQIRECWRDVNSAYVYDSDYVERWIVVKSNECLERNLF